MMRVRTSGLGDLVMVSSAGDNIQLAHVKPHIGAGL